MRPHYVLVLEENDDHAELLTELLDAHAAPVVIHTVDHVTHALSMLSQNTYDLILTSSRVADISLDQFLDDLLEQSQGAPIIVIAGSGNVRAAADFAKRGVSEYLVKTRESLEILPELIQRYLKKRKRPALVKKKKQIFEKVASSENPLGHALRELERITLQLMKLQKRKKEVSVEELLQEMHQLRTILERNL